MNVTIKLPQEWEKEFEEGKFAEFFGRVLADLSRSEVRCLVGNYELETLTMLKDSFAKAEISKDGSEGQTDEEVPEGMEEVCISGSPYCSASGTLYVPTNIVKAGKIDVIKYVEANFYKIKFGEPDLDFCGTDYEIEEDMNGCYSSNGED